MCGVRTYLLCTPSLYREIFVNSPHVLDVVFLYNPPLGPHHPGSVVGRWALHQKRDRSLNLNLWNQCLAMRSLSELSSKAWHIRRLGAAADPVKIIKQWNWNKLLSHGHVSSPLLELRVTCVRNAPAFVKSNAILPPHSRQVTHSFTYQWSLVPTKRKKGKYFFGYLIYVRVF